MKKILVTSAALLVWTAASVGCHRGNAGRFSWQMSTDQRTWSSVSLPAVNFGCTDCDRYFRTTVHGKPSSVKFRFGSDNKARLLVNGTEVFAEFFKDNYCSDQPCCDRCCDSLENCKKVIATGKTYELSPKAITAFKDGDNELVWQVHQEGGGSGFDVDLDVRE